MRRYAQYIYHRNENSIIMRYHYTTARLSNLETTITTTTNPDHIKCWQGFGATETLTQ